MEHGTILEVDSLSYTYLERYPALDAVSLDIARGERVTLLGANGCGKSTLLKVLGGLVFGDTGSFRAYGALVSEEHLEDAQFNEGFRSRVGFVFQNSDAQVFSPTVREEIAFGPLNMGLTIDEVNERIRDVLEMLDIAELSERAPYQLSGGQKKRVAIASVLVMNPEVLLMDEPTSGLDPRTERWFVELIEELHKAGKTLVIATHDLVSLAAMSDRCVVFSEDHRIVADGLAELILRDTDLLLSVNLVHEHGHWHGMTRHSHPHWAGHHTHDDEVDGAGSAKLDSVTAVRP